MDGAVKLFLCGDVMTGRGVDQILPHPGDPELHESWVRNAVRYVELAEAASGKIGRPVDFPYVWGEALEALDRKQPAARIANLETAVTQRGKPWAGKGIHYRMHPANLPVLAAAKLDCCVLANNHVMDYGEEGLAQTLDSLAACGIATAGAGRNFAEASRPAEIEIGGGRRVLVFAFATVSSGVPREWTAAQDRPGVNLLRDLSSRTLDHIAREIAAHRHGHDLVIVSLHWGGNWGYEVEREERHFARGLIEAAGADLVHGHSSHHAKGIEIAAGKLILHGCGDFINDYEGIRGYESYRPELGLMYFAELDAIGRLSSLEMIPMRRERLRLVRAAPGDVDWLQRTMARASRDFGTSIVIAPDDTLRLDGVRAFPHPDTARTDGVR